ncbi:uncharacterized protein LOC114255061 [Monomorium pharaonis]|uniref:uncharacterized protein LOC114255061 n=1 Tax=Monomorium pharaonis TaxID=307658 RepID=UPI0017469089|nr:uncharacterized protein LOC114255061 [Monomorium pharaonis]
MAMHGFETKNRMKFCRKLTNKVHRSLALINNDSKSSCDSYDIDINNDSKSSCDSYNIDVNKNDFKSSCDFHNIDINNDNIIQNIEYDKNNDNVMLHKNSCGINNNYVNVNSTTGNELFHNMNNIDTLLHNVTRERNDVPLSMKLAKWAIEDNIPLSSLRKILSIIREIPGCNDIPKDPRTLLKTPTNVVVTPLGNGTYYYFGIEKTLNLFCINHKISIEQNEEFLLAVNIDGLPLSKSTNSTFWPILCSIKSIKILMKQVFLIALYHGPEKPKSIDDYFRDFVNECIHLSNNGILINSCRYNFRVLMLICDSPAKSFALSIKHHTGYFSCTKCDQEGDMFNNVMCFTETKYFNKRTDTSFRTNAQQDHHTGRSMLLDIPNFNLIDNVPIDYMHCLLLGAMKRLLCHKRYGWIYGKPHYKLRARDVNKISENLSKIKKFIPHEFSRKTRSIIECKRYKATEFRFFVLYAGPIVLKDILSPKIYNHFITLSLASSIMISEYYSKFENYISYAHNLMEHFICQSIKIYGPDFVSHNIHNLLHLSDCVKLYGSLDNFSAFPFENYMQQLKKKVRKTSQPLQQIIHRTIEESNITECTNIIKNDSVKLLIEHFIKMDH